MGVALQGRERWRRRRARRAGPALVLLLAAALAPAAPAATTAAAVATTPTPTWQTNGHVQTVTMVGSVAYLGGTFTSLRPAGDPPGTGEVPRSHAAAIDLATGQLLPWAPSPDGDVHAIVVSNGVAYLGGIFTTAGGAPAGNLAAVDTTDGARLAGWPATANGQVNALALRAGALFVGGDFSRVNSARRANLAALTLATGHLITGWRADTDGHVKALALTADASRLIAGGSFTTVDGARHTAVVAISPTTSAIVPWRGGVSFAVVALAADASAVYIAGGGNGGNFMAVDPVRGTLRWRGGTNGNAQAIASDGGMVVVGGHFTSYCGPVIGQEVCSTGHRRLKLLAVNASTGALMSWNPGANSPLGVFGLTGDSTGMAVVGDFTVLGGAAQQGLGLLPATS